ncbi:MAG: PAS domain S-box protein [Thermoanaerobaculia bacterium]|nr:PAS domain S-box protein [Thermoanaerobaculia bacterium]
MGESDSQFRALFEGLPVPSYIWTVADDQFVLTDYNDAAEEFTDGAVAEFLNKTGREMYPDRPDIVDDLETCRREGRLHRRMVYEMRTTGESFEMNVHYVFLPPDKILVQAEDITERVEAEEKLRQSEARLAAAQRIAQVGNWEWNVRENTVWWSDELYRIFGVDPAEFGADYEAFLALVHPEDRALVDASVRRTLEDDEPYDLEMRIVRPSGEVRLIHGRGEVSTDGSGRPIKMSGTVQDLTERKRVEEALAVSEREYREFFQNLTIGAFRSRSDGTISEVNQALVEILGYDSAEELLATNAEDLYVDPEVRRELWEEAEGSTRGVEVELKRKDGSVVVVLASGREIRGERGEVLHHEGTMVDVTERRRTEEALRRSERQFREFFENLGIGAFRTAPSGKLLAGNAALARILGFDAVEELLGRDVSEFYVDPPERERLLAYLESEGGEARDLEISLRRRDGRVIDILANSQLIRDADGDVQYVQGTMVDVTERRELEEQLRQSQKMEAVGLLAGGIAHDFNNLLTGLIGYTELALGKLERPQQIGEGSKRAAIAADLTEVRRAADRAERLTRQLLAFSRQQVLHPQVVDLNDVVRGVEGLLRRTISEDVELSLDLFPEVAAVDVDPGQMEQVLLNLVINAQEAMPDGGAVELATSLVDLDADFGRGEFRVEPGAYVRLVVRDHGEGMDEETRRRAFDPFFTTKGSGEGSGLGLPMVYGIVKQSRGYIRLESAPGEGTTVEVCLPRSEDEVVALEPSGEVPAADAGRETILLVEDDELVRRLAADTLEDSGYRVLAAATPQTALELFEARGDEVDLVVTDIIMPGLSGPDLVRRLEATGKPVQALYISGHASEKVRERGVLDLETRFLAKPFTPRALVAKVQDVLHGTEAGEADGSGLSRRG